VKVAFLLVPNLHLLDLAGPAQVFSTAADFGYPYELAYVGEQAMVPSAQGVRLGAQTAWPELGAQDLVLVPGCGLPDLGSGPRPSPETLGRLAAHHAAGGTVASVCSGADILGQAGLLDHRRCTTHHDLRDELARRYPLARVERDVLYVLDGRVVTSAGIASGIDLALHLVATRHGPAAAARVARDMVVYARRTGEASQTSAMLRHRWHLRDAVHRAQDLIDAGFAETLPLEDLAAAAGVSPRTLTRQFVQSTGLTPLRYQQTLRIERAEHLMSHGATAESAARAVGFADARMLRRLRSRTGYAPGQKSDITMIEVPDAGGPRRIR
jgi:transcriptional regulator GlxA family with amidase domain